MPKLSPMMFIVEVAIGGLPASFFSANKTSDRSRRSHPPAARNRQPLVSPKMKLRTNGHLSSPTADTFSTPPVCCLEKPESKWECLANPSKMELRLPQA